MRPKTTSYMLYGASVLFTSIAASTSTSTGINGTDIDQQYGGQLPSVVRKMSDDEGEKFYFDYWSWEDPFLSSASRREVVNTSITELVEPQPAILLHTSTDADSLLSAAKKGDYARSARRALFMLLGRDFQCPTGTFSCTSIGQPDSCCGNGATCVIVQDTGLGVVGCCPAGETCGDTVSLCGTGYSSCASSLGGGCCIPGYTCVTGGCAFVSTYTVTRQSTTFISSSTVSTVPTTPTSLPITSSSTQTTRSTTSSSTSSPSSTETSSTVSPAAPVRPTTSSQTTITSSTTSSTSASSTVSTCPTGFYACSAVYEGGCCRTGRNCDTTSCPATSSTTLINTDGVTIAVPTGSAATTATESSGSCATGWFSCASSAGGGCCPSGYVCGSSCTASSSGTATATVVKEQPGVGGRYVADMYFGGVMALLVMIWFHFGV